MLGLVLHLAIRGNRRILLTILGVALAVMYLTGTAALVEGLNGSVGAIGERIDDRYELVLSEQTALSTSWIDSTDYTPVADDQVAGFRLTDAILVNATGDRSRIQVVAIDDSAGMFAGVFGIGNGSALLGVDLAGTDRELVLVRADRTLSVNVTGFYNTTLFPTDWLVLNSSDLDNFAPDLRGGHSFWLLETEAVASRATAEEAGLTLVPTLGALAYFEGGIAEVEATLVGVQMLSGSIVGILIYAIIGIELYSRRQEIRLLRVVGTSRRLLFAVFLTEGLFISIVGSLLGVALGFLVAHGIVSLVPLLGYDSLVFAAASITSIGVPIAVGIGAGALGSALASLQVLTRQVGGI